MTDQDPFVPFGLEIVDALMVLCPRGWKRAQLRLGPRPDGTIRVVELTSEIGRDGTKPKPEIDAEPGVFHGVLNEAVGDWIRTVAAGETMEAVTVTRRDDGGATLELVAGPGHVLHAIPLDARAVTRGMITEALFDLYARFLPDADAAQQSFLEDIEGHDEWDYDAATGTLSLARGVLPWRKYRAHVLGTWAQASGTFLWSWSNRALPSTASDAARALRDRLAPREGMTLFRQSPLPCDERFASVLALISAAELGAAGVYPASYGEGILYLAIAGPSATPQPVQ